MKDHSGQWVRANKCSRRITVNRTVNKVDTELFIM